MHVLISRMKVGETRIGSRHIREGSPGSDNCAMPDKLTARRQQQMCRGAKCKNPQKLTEVVNRSAKRTKFRSSYVSRSETSCQALFSEGVQLSFRRVWRPCGLERLVVGDFELQHYLLTKSHSLNCHCRERQPLNSRCVR